MCLFCLLSLKRQASHQLRFLREWAVFGRALRRSVWEFLGVAVALLLLVLAYSHTGHLVRLKFYYAVLKRGHLTIYIHVN